MQRVQNTDVKFMSLFTSIRSRLTSLQPVRWRFFLETCILRICLQFLFERTIEYSFPRKYLASTGLKWLLSGERTISEVVNQPIRYCIPGQPNYSSSASFVMMITRSNNCRFFLRQFLRWAGIRLVDKQSAIPSAVPSARCVAYMHLIKIASLNTSCW